MKKRILFLALALTLLASLALGLAAPAFAAADDFVIEDGALTGYNGPGGNVVIPDGVTYIAHEVFYDCSDITSVTIPSSVTDIGMSVFEGCTGLTSITIPQSVTDIGDGAFTDCTGLTGITIPGSVTTIDCALFSDCTGLTDITIPDGVTLIDTSAFANCTGLTRITIPGSVTVIENGVFSGCDNLTVVYYAGTEALWNALDIGGFNGPLETAAIHYGGAAPAVPNTAPATTSTGNDPAQSGTAVESTQPVEIGGKKVELQAYALTGASGSTNYVKIRDVAAALDGTASQFDVQWDGTINLVTKTAYTSRNGQENKTPYSGDRTYTKSTADTKVNGVVTSLQAFVLKDDAGNGSTYYKLRDLGQALGFNVGWDKDRGIYIEPGVPYDPAN